MEIDPRVHAELRAIRFGAGAPLGGRVFEIKAWGRWPIQKQLAFIRLWIETTARDPHLADFAVTIFRAAGVDQRQHDKQWAALLAWAQRNLYYVNEKRERLQSPQFTLTRGLGDCDDLIIATLALGESIRLPWRLVISGYRANGQKVRYVEGSGPVPTGVKWSHIYGLAGWPPFKPERWAFLEPTLSVPFGWDVMAGSTERGAGAASRRLPEMGGTRVGFGAASAPAAVAVHAPPPPSAPSPAIQRAGAELVDLVDRQNRGNLSWIGFERGRWIVHVGGCTQTALRYPSSWRGYPVVRRPGGIVAVRPPALVWYSRAAIEFARQQGGALGDASVPGAAPGGPMHPLFLPVRYVAKLPWTQIVIATLPTVLAAWMVGRFMTPAAATTMGGADGCSRRRAA